MILISNRFLRFISYLNGSTIIGITLFPFIIIKKDANSMLINHEKIHFRQQIEMLVVFFYLWYIIEFIFKGYKGISFEREAYINQNNLSYLKNRRFWSFIKYIK